MFILGHTLTIKLFFLLIYQVTNLRASFLLKMSSSLQSLGRYPRIVRFEYLGQRWCRNLDDYLQCFAENRRQHRVRQHRVRQRRRLTAGKINYNTASKREIMSVKQIGEILSQRIIDNRPYSKIEELQQLKMIGCKRFSNLNGAGYV